MGGTHARFPMGHSQAQAGRLAGPVIRQLNEDRGLQHRSLCCANSMGKGAGNEQLSHEPR